MRTQPKPDSRVKPLGLSFSGTVEKGTAIILDDTGETLIIKEIHGNQIVFEKQAEKQQALG